MRLAMSYFGFRRGEWNEHSPSYVIDIQRSMNIEIAIEAERSSDAQSMNGVVRGALIYYLGLYF